MKDTYHWKCGICHAGSKVPLNSIEDAARAGVLNHVHTNGVYVTDNNGEYVGLSEGLLFHVGKVFNVPPETICRIDVV